MFDQPAYVRAIEHDDDPLADGSAAKSGKCRRRHAIGSELYVPLNAYRPRKRAMASTEWAGISRDRPVRVRRFSCVPSRNWAQLVGSGFILELGEDPPSKSGEPL